MMAYCTYRYFMFLSPRIQNKLYTISPQKVASISFLIQWRLLAAAQQITVFACHHLVLDDPAAGFEGPAVPLFASGVFSTLSFLWRDVLAFWVVSCSILFLMATSKPCTKTQTHKLNHYFTPQSGFKSGLNVYLLQLLLLDHLSFLGSDDPS